MMPGEELDLSGGALIGQFANLAANMAMNGWNNRAAARLAGQANQWNIEQWNRQNQYNLPENQLARLRAAGINPALAMAGGASSMLSGQIADPIHPANVPQTAPPPYNSIDPALMQRSLVETAQARLANAQADNIEQKTPAEVRNLNASSLKLEQDAVKVGHEIANLDEDTLLKASQRAYNEMQTSIGPEVANAQIGLWNSQAGLAESQKIKTTEEYNQLVAFMSLRKENLRLTNDQIRKAMQVDDATIAHLNSLVSFYTAQTVNDYSKKMVGFRENLIQEQTRYYEALAGESEDHVNRPERYRNHSSDGGFSILGSGVHWGSSN